MRGSRNEAMRWQQVGQCTNHDLQLGLVCINMIHMHTTLQGAG